LTRFEPPPPAHRGGSGTPLVLLHGFSGTWPMWLPQIAALEAEHEVFAPTLPGHWGGPRIPDGVEPTMAVLVDATERMLDEAGIERAHLAGNSLGGWLSLELAARGRALSVTAISPGCGWREGGFHARRIEFTFRRNYRASRASAPYADVLMRRPRMRELGFWEIVARPRLLPPSVAAQWVRGAANCPFYMDFVRAVKREGLRDLGPIERPVRIAWGTKDRLLPLRGCSERHRELVPDAEWVVLDGLGHSPFYDDPPSLVDTILEQTRARNGRTPPGGRSAGEDVGRDVTVAGG
jgi:pimeloyl-ACP methyl ester carboxylesterase